MNALAPSSWTPRLVRDEMIEAVTWVRYQTGPAGPAGIKSLMPAYNATLEDHLAEGWGIPERAEDSALEERRLRLPPSPERVERFLDTFSWPARYIGSAHPGSARMLALWLRCKTQGDGKGFDRAVKRLQVSRAHAYRLRDRGLSMIACGLAEDGIAP